MKKSFVLCAAAIMAGLVSCNQEQLEKQQKTIDSLKEVSASKDSSMSLLAITISDVQKNLNYIKEKEGIISMSVTNSENNKDQLKSDVEAIYARMVENKKKVEELQRRLNASASKNKEYQKVIEVLNQQIAQQNTEIERLNKVLEQKDVEIGFLNNAVITLSSKVDSIANVSVEQANKISQQTADLERGFYIIGERSYLKEKGLIEGIFKKTTTGNVTESLFTQINTTTTEQIPLTGRRWTVISSHPESSYTIDEAKSVLIIKDKEAFWKSTKYLIIRARGVNED